MPHKDGEAQHFYKSAEEKSIHRNSKKKALEKVKGKRKPFYTRADGTHETKKEYQLRHGADLSKYENN